MSTIIDEAVAVVRTRLADGRRCVNGADPDAAYPVPTDWQEDEEFQLAPDLERIARLLIDVCPELAHLNGLEIRYCWKRKGSKQHGKAVLGTCQKPSGLLAYFSGADFVVWLSAQWLTDMRATNWQVEAILHHEMSHTGYDDETDTPTVVAHDFADFRSTLERYGFYLDDLIEAADSFRQASLGLA